MIDDIYQHDFINAQEAADILEISKATFCNWRSSNYKGARELKKIGRKFSRKNVQEFKESLL